MAVTAGAATPREHGDVGGLALGFASHLLAGLSPFIVAAVIARTSLLTGTALVYGLGAIALAALLVPRRFRQRFREETTSLVRAPLRNAFLWSLAGFLVAGVAYYVGLASSARVAEYVFLTRLDWVVQAPVAIVVLREPWTRGGLAGAGLALAGGVLIVWTGLVGTSGLLAAACYVLASIAGYLGATRIARTRGLRGAVALTVWRHWGNTVGFIGLALFMSQTTHLSISSSTLPIALLSALVLIGLFLTRFAALTRLPLWVLSAQAPVQAIVALIASRITEGVPSPTTLLAVAMIVGGELLVARSLHTRG